MTNTEDFNLGALAAECRRQLAALPEVARPTWFRLLERAELREDADDPEA